MTNPQYREAFEASQAEAAQSLEDEAIRRAHEGVFEPLVYQGTFSFEYEDVVDEEGEVIGRQRASQPLGIRKYSDAVLMFLLRGARPEKYRETWKGEISGPGGGPIPLEEQRLRALTDDELAQLISIARKLNSASEDGSGVPPPRGK